MLPEIHEVYVEALTYLASDNVMVIYNAYTELQTALMFMSYDDDFAKAMEGFEAVLDIFNEISEEEMEDLAALLVVEDGETAFWDILSDWITANVVDEIGQLYNAYLENPNKETAAALIEYYDSIYNDPEYADEELQETISWFFMDIHDVYAEASALVADEVADVVEPEEADVVEPEEADGVEPERQASPKTGDAASIIWPVAGILVAMAAFAVTKKQKE